MWKSIVKKQMRYNRNHDVCKKVNLFFEADKLKNIELACKRLGYKRSYYYYWWNRLKQANWKTSALLELSRRPKSHPNTTKPQLVKLIKAIRTQTKYGPQRIAYYLKKRSQLNPSSFYYLLTILRWTGLSRPKINLF